MDKIIVMAIGVFVIMIVVSLLAYPVIDDATPEEQKQVAEALPVMVSFGYVFVTILGVCSAVIYFKLKNKQPKV